MKIKQLQSKQSQSKQPQSKLLPYIIYGKHAVSSALENKKRKIFEVFATASAIKSMPQSLPQGIRITTVTNDDLQTLTNNAPHQGIAAKVAPITQHFLDKNLLADAKSKIVILDQVTDPQNLGAILRSAAAFGISAVICTKHGSASENGTVAKAACGALDIVPLIEVTNIAHTVSDLKKEGFWVIAMDGSSKHTIDKAHHLFNSKIAVVMGSEGLGIRPLVIKNCDMIVKLPINSTMESLNVSNAASILMWELSKSEQPL